MIREINQVTLILQRRAASLNDCRLTLENLIDSVSNERNQELSPFYRCRLSGVIDGIDPSCITLAVRSSAQLHKLYLDTLSVYTGILEEV